MFMQAIEECQREVAQQEGVAVEDVCWFIHTSYPIDGSCLAYSCGHSPQCTLSCSLTYAVSSLECMLLVCHCSAA